MDLLTAFQRANTYLWTGQATQENVSPKFVGSNHSTGRNTDRLSPIFSVFRTICNVLFTDRGSAVLYSDFVRLLFGVGAVIEPGK